MVALIAFDSRQVLARQQEIVQVYRQAFWGPPYNKAEDEVAEFRASLPHHVYRAGFTFLAALDGDRLAGFAYGNTPRPGQGWHDHVRDALPEAHYRAWLPGSFQLAEMAVAPDCQRQGIGRRLHDSLLAGVPHERAVLTTMTAETTAYHLYRSRGWIVLLEGHYFPGVARPYSILGLDLRSWRLEGDRRGVDGSG